MTLSKTQWPGEHLIYSVSMFFAQNRAINSRYQDSHKA